MTSIRPTTTPTIYCDVDADLTGWTLKLTLASKFATLVIKHDRMACTPTDEGCLITCTLTSEETALLTPGTVLKGQLNYSKDGDRHATDIGSVHVDEMLNCNWE